MSNELYIEEANEKLVEQIKWIQSICSNKGLTIESDDYRVFVVLHFKNKHGQQETIKKELETCPF
jgi:hypothetical protein